MERLSNWGPGLPERHGRKTLILLVPTRAFSDSGSAHTWWSSRWRALGDDAHADDDPLEVAL